MANTRIGRSVLVLVPNPPRTNNRYPDDYRLGVGEYWGEPALGNLVYDVLRSPVGLREYGLLRRVELLDGRFHDVLLGGVACGKEPFSGFQAASVRACVAHAAAMLGTARKLTVLLFEHRGHTVHQNWLEELLRREGFQKFQIMTEGDPGEDIVRPVEAALYVEKRASSAAKLGPSAPLTPGGMLLAQGRRRAMQGRSEEPYRLRRHRLRAGTLTKSMCQRANVLTYIGAVWEGGANPSKDAYHDASEAVASAGVGYMISALEDSHAGVDLVRGVRCLTREVLAEASLVLYRDGLPLYAYLVVGVGEKKVRNITKPRPRDMSEMQIILEVLGLRVGEIVYVSRDSFRTSARVVHHDPAILDTLFERTLAVREAVAEGVLPPVKRVGGGKPARACSYCGFKDFCWERGAL